MHAWRALVLGGLTREERAGLYAEYLQSSDWEFRRKRALRLAQWQCQCPICPNKSRPFWIEDLPNGGWPELPLHVHHLTYERMACENDDDLIVLCEECHQQIHGLVPLEESPREWRAYRQWLIDGRWPRKEREHAS